jgi:HEAT repeat protein
VLTINACRALLRRGTHRCGAAMVAQAKDVDQPIVLRLAALGALSGAASPNASVPELTRTVAAAARADDRALAQGLIGLPDEVAVPVWTRLAETGPREVQYLAIGALGRADTPEARRALEAIKKRGAPPGLTFAVTMALARAGDAASLGELKKAIPLLQGSDVLAVAEILQANGETAAATPLLRQAAGGDNELVRVEAAARLGPGDAELAGTVLKSARASENPLVRAAAFQAFRASPLLEIPAILEGLGDPDPWVRLRAADAATAMSARAAAAGSGRAPR